VYLGLPEARRLLRFGHSTEVFDTGNPITPPLPERKNGARAKLGLSGGTRPVVLVTGGSQGALALNQAMATWLDQQGPGEAEWIWVTGRATYQQFEHYRSATVHVFDFLDPMADAYAVADLVVSRAGMITVAELCAWGLPSVLIPLPTAAADHQTHNARVLAEAGASIVLPQSELTPERLADTVTRLLTEPGLRKQMAERARARGRPNSAREIVSNLLTLIK
jgi:UDP-N-acetylglucosamine--N-acetylmuramyl-(pentapeptide) pyrophosphoryl-undecaprenol N-acetylglucosamine transferase